MTLPSRGHECRHLQCFDLESYLKANGERGLWKCPVCNKPSLLEGLEIDQFTWSILQTQRFADVDEVAVDAMANVKPILLKKEDSGNTSSEPMSPASLKLPNLALWEIPSTTRSPALYAPPDMNSASNIQPTRNSISIQRLIRNFHVTGIVTGQYPLEESGGPLSQMNEAVNNIDRPKNTDDVHGMNVKVRITQNQLY